MSAPTRTPSRARQRARTADPYRDLSVIDARAPRFNQAVVGALSLAGALSGWWAFFALVALQLTLGLRLGRRWCLPCVFYFELVQPRVGEGPLEDARPPRFANLLGAALLWAAAAAGAGGLRGPATALGGLVAVLALLSAGTGFCAGCFVYRLGALLRGVRRGAIDRVDLLELGVPLDQPALVQFTHPLCADCQVLSRQLEAAGRAPVLVDVARHPDLARKYGVAVVPTLVEVDPGGAVRRTLRG